MEHMNAQHMNTGTEATGGVELADTLKAIKASYDQFPYTSYPFSHSYPGHVRTVARMLGLDAPALDQARVLELGCAGGGNLIPFAVRYPQSQVVGVDLSGVHIHTGNGMVAKLDLANVKLMECSITEVDDSFGKFDYIIAHGVYSWVTDEVRRKIMSICKENLSADGVAYISYNTLPGWNTLATIRDMALFHANHFSQIPEKIRQAKAFLNFTSDAVRNSGHGYARILMEAVQLLRNKPDYYFAHDFLEINNRAFYFSQFVEDARKAGLQYLCDANLPDMYLQNYPDEIMEKMSEVGDVVRMQQYLDFITNKSFRSTLLCHGNVRINRNVDLGIMRTCHLKMVVAPEAGNAQSVHLADERPVRFHFDGQTENSITTDSRLLKALLYALSETSGYIHYDELMGLAMKKIPDIDGAEIEEQANRNLLELFLRGKLGLRMDPVPAQTRIVEKPTAWEYARAQAYDLGNPAVTNLYHEVVPLSLMEMFLIRHLDGRHTREQVLELLAHDVRENGLEVNYGGNKITDGEKLKMVLSLMYMDGVERFAENGLLVK